MPFALPRLPADVVDGLKRGLFIGAAAAALLIPPIHYGRQHWQRLHAPAPPVAAAPARAQPAVPRFADFGGLQPPTDVRRIADWVTDARDNGGLDFIVLDKRGAHVYVFDPAGRLRDHTPVLLGAAAGDDTAEGVGQKALHEVKPEERTTPAGRFVGQSGLNAHGEDVFWVDYDAAVSMHRVRQIEPHERRLERLASPSADDNRISYGCINMPVAFFETVMLPTFLGRKGMVYVLPEVRTFEQVFPAAYDVAARYRTALLKESNTPRRRG
jgi:hypothetical protein